MAEMALEPNRRSRCRATVREVLPTVAQMKQTGPALQRRRRLLSRNNPNELDRINRSTPGARGGT